jgi:AmmeMemoRadiSam system protein A
LTNDVDRALLLDVAREAIAAHVGGRDARLPPIEGVFARAAGAFVSLHSNGELRGCVGHIEADDVLGRVIPRCAVAAGSNDPRFPAVAEIELASLSVELSLLGPLEPIEEPEAIDVGRHGLVVESGWRRGLLLPQVAIEWRWDPKTFLARACEKAGLPRDAWKEGVKPGMKPGVKLWRFEAEVFSDASGGSVTVMSLPR